MVENVATPQKATLLTDPPVSSTNTAAPDARLPILITSIVPEAVSSKRLTVWPLTVRVPKSSSAPPRIASRGVSLSSLNRPPARNSMPPLIEMKKMRDCDWLPPPPVVPAAAAWSNSWKESEGNSPGAVFATATDGPLLMSQDRMSPLVVAPNASVNQ